MIEIAINNLQSVHPIDANRYTFVARSVLEGENVDSASISLAVVDDATIRKLNRQYLGHDYPTDVLSFLLEHSDHHLEGEVVVSVQTAAHVAPRYQWSAADELLLYVVHGVLHLIGYDDQSPRDRARMRDREQFYLSKFDLARVDTLGASMPTPDIRSVVDGGKERREPTT